MIEAVDLSKSYGDKRAVDGLTFTVRPGVVTGFLGPNGAGKSTTMRLILGLDRPTSGRVTVNGKPYAEHAAPMAEVGALLEAKAVHTSRSAYNHLRALAASHGVARSRIDEVIDLVGLSRGRPKARRQLFSWYGPAAGHRLGTAGRSVHRPARRTGQRSGSRRHSMGRDLLRGLADEGRTVFLSSHLMSEMALTAEHVIVVGRGRLIADMSIADLISSASGKVVRVRTPEGSKLREAIAGPGVSVTVLETGLFEVSGVSAEDIGRTAFAGQIPIYELTPREVSLEDAYMDMTRDSVEYTAKTPFRSAA